MSRVGVRTLLTWYRTKLPIDMSEINNGFINFIYSKDLKVWISRGRYVIWYENNMKIIEMCQKYINSRYEIYMYYTNYQSGLHNHFSFNEHKVILGYLGFTDKLLQIPITNIFTMFPVIVNIIHRFE